MRLHYSFEDEYRNLYLVLDYVVGGELFQHLRRYALAMHALSLLSLAVAVPLLRAGLDRQCL